MTTIVDVARQAGVSIATVSNLINGRDGRMRPETRARVEAAISALGFQPNRAARQLKTGQTQLFGLLIPSMANPSYGELAREVEAVALDRHGHRLIVASTGRDAAQEQALIGDLLSHGVRGVMVISSLGAEGHFDALIRRGLVAVSYDSHARPGRRPRMDYVSADNALGGRLAVEHLLALGHRSLAFLTPTQRTFSRLAKLEGFSTAATAGGARACVITGRASSAYGDGEMAELGQSLARAVLEHPDRPTGLLAMNDMMAFGLLAGLRDCGIAVPEQISVIGMDGLALGAFSAPPLTSVRLPREAMARRMVDRLMQRIEAPETPPEEFRLPPDLIARRSTASAPRSP